MGERKRKRSRRGPPASYGMKLYRYGVELRSDGRRRERLPGGHRVIVRQPSRTGFRGKIRAWSRRSANRLNFILTNADAFFQCIVTLTYRARVESWESDGERNLRIVRRSHADRHRFLCCVRGEIGAYGWVREFQERGVLHYHVLCEELLSQARATEVWCRASDQLHDEDVARHGVKVDQLRSERGARRYVGRYVGKERQKRLPEGVEGAGRWWGRSRSLNLAVLDDIVWLDRSDGMRRPCQLRIVRILRKHVERTFGRKYRGGAFVDYGGKLSATLASMAATLRSYYGYSPTLDELLAANGWEDVGGHQQ